MVLNRVGLSGATGMLGRAIAREMIGRGITGSLSSRTTIDSNHSSFSWSHWDLTEWKNPEELGDVFGKI